MNSCGIEQLGLLELVYFTWLLKHVEFRGAELLFMDMQGSKGLLRQWEREKSKREKKERPSLLELCRICIAFSL